MVEVKVNNKSYKLFKQIDITRSMDEFSGEARIIISEQSDNQSFAIIQDLIQILLDGIPVITGYIEKISDGENVGSHDISFVIRDKIADLIDSSIPDNLKSVENVSSYAQLCQLAIDGLGLTGEIQVIDEVNAIINKDDIKAGEIGGNIYDFLNEYARKVQVFLNTDGKGNILIRRPGESKLKTILANVPGFNRNNILDSNIDLNYSDRFNKYVVRSNDSLSSETGGENLDNSGEAFDDEIRESRIFEKIAETPLTAEECKAAAEEEANIRRIRGFAYTVTVAGFSANGELWDVGKIVTVKDIKRQVIGEFLIKDISWSFSEAGEITTMNLTYPDAYTVKPVTDKITEKTTKIAETYTVVKGDTLSEIAVLYGLTTRQLWKANPEIIDPHWIDVGQQIRIPVKEI